MSTLRTVIITNVGFWITTTDLDFNVATECHAKLVLGVPGKDSLKCLLEQGCVERIRHHHVTSTDRHTGLAPTSAFIMAHIRLLPHRLAEKYGN